MPHIPPVDDASGLDTVRAIAELSPDILSVLDAEGRLVYNSAAAERIHGWPVAEMIGRSTMDYVHPDDKPAVEAAFARLLAQPAESVRVRYRYRHRDGSWTAMEATGRNLLDDPRVRGIIAVSRDLGAPRVGPAEPALSIVSLDVGYYDPGVRTVVTARGGRTLSPIEARLLDHLAARPGEFVRKETLLSQVWGYADRVRSRTVYTTVERLRAKVEADPVHPRHLVSRRGLGYAFFP